MIFGILAALAGTVGYGTASVLQAAAASRASGTTIWRHPLYLGGLIADGLAWTASIIALRTLPVFAVQALLAGSLAITVLLAATFLTLRLRRRDVIAVTAIVVALVLIAASAGPQSTVRRPPAFTSIMIVSAVATALVLVALFGRGNSQLLAVIAGIAFSGAALCGRAVGGIDSWMNLVTSPLSWSLIVFGAAGAIAYIRALEHGNVGAATATMWVVEVIVPGVVGVAALGDRVRPGWAIPALVAVALSVTASAVLATSPTNTVLLAE